MIPFGCVSEPEKQMKPKIIEQRLLKRLEEKGIELENVGRVNAYLQEKVNLMGTKKQMWFNAVNYDFCA